MQSSTSSLRLWAGAFALLMIMITAGCGSDDAPSDDAGDSSTLAADSSSLVDVIRSDSRFSTLATALDSSGLDSTLAAGGPYTLFAPTNNAFGRLPEGTVPDLLDRENRDRLRTILSHHVVGRRLMSQDVSDMTIIETLEGSTVPVSSDDATLRVGNATVLDADIETANGVIHVVNEVLRPPAAARE
jgi:uncharacterized surface protein with fasciclin (FAS1) repeats